MKLFSFKLNPNTVASAVGLVLAMLFVSFGAFRADNHETAMRRLNIRLEACT